MTTGERPISFDFITWIALAGFTLSWFDAQGHAPRWRAWSIPIAAWLMAGLLGAITLMTMAQA